MPKSYSSSFFSDNTDKCTDVTAYLYIYRAPAPTPSPIEFSTHFVALYPEAEMDSWD